MVTTAGIRENGGGRRTPRRRTTLKVCGRIGFREPSMNYSIPCSPSLRMTLEKLGELTLGCCSRYRLWGPKGLTSIPTSFSSGGRSGGRCCRVYTFWLFFSFCIQPNTARKATRLKVKLNFLLELRALILTSVDPCPKQDAKAKRQEIIGNLRGKFIEILDEDEPAGPSSVIMQSNFCYAEFCF